MQQRTKQVADHVARVAADANTSAIHELERRVNRAEVDAVHLKDRVETLIIWLVITAVCLAGTIVKILLT